MRNIFCLNIAFLFVFCLVGFTNPLLADLIDEFDSGKLDTDLWEMKMVGDASYEIDDGILTLISPSTESGIILYLPMNIEDVDITFEVKVDTSQGMDYSYPFGSIAQIMEPQINTDINNNWMAMFLLIPDGTVIMKNDPENIGQQIAPNASQVMSNVGWNVFAIEFSASQGKVIYYLDGKEIGVVDKNPKAKERYFYFSPDLYTTHYTGTANIEYIKISGPGSMGLVVEPLGKLATTWANVKQQ